jgi:hypothetical protein
MPVIKSLLSFCAAAALLSFAAHVSAQVLQGRVVNRSGAPIRNALVRVAAAGNIYSITDANGAFSLNGKVGDTLTVAAFKYADYSVRAPSASGVTVALADDPLLGTLVYHNNFNYIRPGGSYGKYDALRDFNTYKSSGLVKPGDPTDHAYIDTTNSYDGVGSSMRVMYPKGQITSGTSGIQISIPLSNDPKINLFAADALYFSYWFKLGPGFELNCGGKMPGLAGSQVGNDDNKRWSGRWMFRYGGSLQFYMHYAGKADNDDQVTLFDWGSLVRPNADPPCSDEVWTPYLRTNVWHHIEMRYKLNTPGRADGELEGWLDGTAAHFLKTGINDYRIPGISDDITLNSIFFSTFYGGSKPYFAPTKDVYAWFDEFRVSTRRIGYQRPATTR